MRQDHQGVRWDHGDPQESLNHEVPLGQRDSKGFRVVRGFKAFKVQLEPQEQQEGGSQEPQEEPEQQDPQDP